MKCKQQRLTAKLLPLKTKNIIDFLRLAQESNIYSSDEMRKKFKHAEKLVLKSNVQSNEKDADQESENASLTQPDKIEVDVSSNSDKSEFYIRNSYKF